MRVLLYFIGYLFLETWLTIEIGGAIGGLWTFIEIIASAALGVLLIANFRAGVIETLTALVKKEIDKSQFLTYHIGRLLGALLLIVPGFLTDIIGVFLQFSLFTLTINKLIFGIIPRSQNSYPKSYNNERNKDDEQIIDVDVIMDSDNKYSHSQ